MKMKTSILAVLLFFASTSGGCSPESGNEGSNIQPPVGGKCRVNCARDSLASRQGSLVAVTEEWVVLAGDKGEEFWIPRRIVLNIDVFE